MKHLEGKTIYLRATGNNARRGGGDKITTAFVEKVARVFATIKIDGHSWSDKYRIQENYSNGRRVHLDGGHNSGYYLYESQEDIERQIETDLMASKISDKYKYSSDWKNVEYHTIKEICELLDI